MQVNLTITINDIENESVDYCLISKEVNNKIIWRNVDNNYNKDFELEIITNNSMEVKKIILGKNIVDTEKDITEQFKEKIFQLKLNERIDEADGIEHTNEESLSDTGDITDPYDPKLIRVDPKNFSISETFRMIMKGTLDIDPDFQRNFVWTDITRKSRLIESILLRIPLPVFYLSESKDGIYQVVDGVQRLTVIKSFILNEFKLKNLEYLSECEGKFFKREDLSDDKSISPIYLRRIETTMLYYNVIDSQTPENVRYDIFKRINTGGKVLNKQEVRNCLCKKTQEIFLRG